AGAASPAPPRAVKRAREMRQSMGHTISWMLLVAGGDDCGRGYEPSVEAWSNGVEQE
ncbi:MAG: hypothetical protein QOD85_711, partial [Gaiellaceae bacterium]|nr:hypothetical protein [Gaiellaceae bacterium]